jgi:alkanesulfonate monooxygenase SsuD/methylene tetrahydromethanopterin reductase-like flavin-dependent oxidoreductase (luciferase family)
VSQSVIKLGVLLPTRGLLMGASPPINADQIFSLAQQVEAGGLDSLWVGDSLTAKPRLEPLTTLAAVASRTRRVRLGTAVLLAALRHPVLLAQTMATLDVISGGRFVLAAGVGGAFNDQQKREWQSAGVLPSQRAGRLEEMVQILRGLGSGRPFSFSGRYFNLDSVEMEPRPVQPGGIPILLACHWGAGRIAQLRRAARWGDGWISVSDTPEEYAQLSQKVRGLANEMGRDPNHLEAVMYMTVNVDQNIAKAEAEAEKYLLAYYGANIWGTRWGPFGDPERVTQRIAQYAEAGVQCLVVRFASINQERQLDIFLNRVAPAFL